MAGSGQDSHRVTAKARLVLQGSQDIRHQAACAPSRQARVWSWPIAQIAIISSITCSTDSHLWALIVEPYCYRELRMLENLAKVQMVSSRTYYSYTCWSTLYTEEHICSHMPHKHVENRERFSWHYVSWHEAFVLSPPSVKEKIKNILCSVYRGGNQLSSDKYIVACSFSVQNTKRHLSLQLG